MTKPSPPLKLLLIQVRGDANVAEHEQICVAETLGILHEHITAIDVDCNPVPELSSLKNFDAVILGGAGVHSVTKDYPFTAPLTALIREVANLGIPTLGICWGHQFIAKALGGEVIFDAEASEVGPFPVTLTAAGKSHPIHEDFPDSFIALIAHQDRVSRLPEGAIELAYSEKCRNQMFTFDDKPIIGIQFHAEQSSERFAERLLSIGIKHYTIDPKVYDQVVTSRIDTPHANELMARFFLHWISLARTAP